MTDAKAAELVVRDLGRLNYQRALAIQRQTHDSVLQDRSPPTLLLVEHDPVITISRRKNARRHLLAAPQRLAELGIDVQETDRGGDITYHGPGQLVAYPIVRLTPLGLNVGRYMRLLEQIVIDTAALFGIAGRRMDGCTGVWVDMDAAVDNAKPQAAKLAAMGVRVKRNVTMHGLALNVDPDLSHYDCIVPCGIADKTVTSMRWLLGDDCPTFNAVKAELVRQSQQHLAALTHGWTVTVES